VAETCVQVCVREAERHGRGGGGGKEKGEEQAGRVSAVWSHGRLCPVGTQAHSDSFAPTSWPRTVFLAHDKAADFAWNMKHVAGADIACGGQAYLCAALEGGSADTVRQKSSRCDTSSRTQQTPCSRSRLQFE
jgi:hypothetical protein